MSDFDLDLPIPPLDEDPMSLDELMDGFSGKKTTPNKKFTFQQLRDTIAFRVNDTLREMESFRLAPKAKQLIEEFLTFHLQVKHLADELPEIWQTYCNLLLRSDSREPADRLVTKLRESLELSTLSTITYSEAELMTLIDSGGRLSRSSFKLQERHKLIYIHSCQAPPQVDADLATSAMINDAKRKQDAYQQLWKTVFAHLKQNPDTILIVQAEDAVYRNDLRRNKALFYRICSNHIFIPPSKQEDLWQACLRQLQDTAFVLTPEFKEALHTYFEAVYPKAELREYEFVEDLLRRIYALYLCKPRQTKELTPDCIPKYQSQVISPEDVLGQMNALVGLSNVKSQFRDIYKMQLLGLGDDKKSRYHMIFTGNPGTGKTTVAQMAADLFYRMGILKTNRLVVAKATDMISQWIGGTGIKTTETIRKAYDGVLFIDEAYGIADSKNGPEAINVLIQEMEANADRLVVILAGYKKEMADFMDLNPGFASRIGRTIEFEDYSVPELVQIFQNRCRQDGFAIQPGTEQLLEECLSSKKSTEYFGNAREVNNILQRLKEIWSRESYDALQAGQEPERVFTLHHFAQLMPPKSEQSIADLIGLTTLKESLEQFKQQVAYQKFLRQKNMRAFPSFSMHMLFTGNPGTGKTTVAKLLANDLYAIGILKSNRLVVAERKDLVAVHVGETAPKVQKLVQRAAGGVLFIDEAYSLIAKGDNDHSTEAVEVLLTAMEEYKSDTVFIFAGYDRQMQEFLDTNPGIRSRIGYTFHFDDYSPAELVQIFERSVAKAAMTITPEALKKVEQVMEYFHTLPNFGNGRFVSHVFRQTIFRRAGRDYSQQYRDITEQDIPDIKTLIDTAPDGMKLYDPGELTEEKQYRTAVHEVGHALVQYITEPKNPPLSLSIRNQAGSYGRVLMGAEMEITEEKLLHRIAVAMGGMYAERVILGSHSTGGAGDYAKAKALARDMLHTYAMDAYGKTPEEILEKGKQLAMQILQENKASLERCAKTLLEKATLNTEEFLGLLDQQ